MNERRMFAVMVVALAGFALIVAGGWAAPAMLVGAAAELAVVIGVAAFAGLAMWMRRGR